MKKIILPCIVIALACLGTGCYYDKESELYPALTCDTTAVTFSGTVLPILQSRCALAGCHAAPTPQSGVLLTGYDGAKIIALDGTLLGTINHQPGHDAMPQNTDKLPDCEIAKIQIWVAAGSPNN